MGAYMSEPVKEKDSESGGDARFSYGASSMQGWRISQEDAHNCILGLSDEAKLALFAVYDGHGGAEVAQYTAQHFPQHILKEKLASSKTNFSEILVDAFLSFDLHLKQAHVLHKLREMASGGGKPNDKDADPKEARMLQKEASMPLEQILAKYVHQRANKLLKERRRGDGEEVSDEEDDEEEEDDDDDDEEEDEDDDDDEEENRGVREAKVWHAQLKAARVEEREEESEKVREASDEGGEDEKDEDDDDDTDATPTNAVGEPLTEDADAEASELEVAEDGEASGGIYGGASMDDGSSMFDADW